MSASSGVPGVPPPSEPDYRMSLAVERTYLAYLRTALALTAGGVAVVAALPSAGAESLRRVMGALLIALGVMVAATARLRWVEVDRAMRQGSFLPRSRTTLPLTIGVTCVALMALIAVAIL